MARRLRQADLGAGSVAPAPALPLGRRNGGGERKRDLVRLPIAVLLPGLAFFAMGRPVPGLACLALQASLVGWLPAAVWAACATRQARQKQRALAGRLRPN